MRAPQYGHSKAKGKRRANNAALPPAPEWQVKHTLRPEGIVRDRKLSRNDQRIYRWGTGHFSRGLTVAYRGGSN